MRWFTAFVVTLFFFTNSYAQSSVHPDDPQAEKFLEKAGSVLVSLYGVGSLCNEYFSDSHYDEVRDQQELDDMMMEFMDEIQHPPAKHLLSLALGRMQEPESLAEMKTHMAQDIDFEAKRDTPPWFKAQALCNLIKGQLILDAVNHVLDYKIHMSSKKLESDK